MPPPLRVRAVRGRGEGVPGVRVRQEWQRLRQLFVMVLKPIELLDRLDFFWRRMHLLHLPFPPSKPSSEKKKI